MAQVLGDDWRVVGVDNHKGALQRASALARVSGATVELERIDLRKDHLEHLEGHVALVHGCRFLDRALLQTVRDRLLQKVGRTHACDV